MKLYYGIESIKENALGCVATVGNFDGVHLGHQALLALLCTRAQRLKLPTAVVLFEPQPGEYFGRSATLTRLYSLREKIKALQQCGIDLVYCLRFDKELANMSAHVFAHDVLFSLIKANHLLLGHDFQFGRNRCGNLDTLIQMGAQEGVTVETCPEFCVEGVRVSSTQIRQYLQNGDLDSASRCLGRPYSISGRVVYGQGLGRTLGFPTANINVRHRRLALRGVFSVDVRIEDQTVYPGVANIGTRPTLNGTCPVLEVHLFDFKGSLYGQRLEVFFLQKLRDEMKFSSIESLSEQIQLDILQAKSKRVMCA